jgi:hypothetical protein
MTTAQDGGKVVSLTHRHPLPQEMLLVLISVTGWVDPRAIVPSEGICQWEIPVTPSGIEPATFRFVAQYLNHCATISGLQTIQNTRHEFCDTPLSEIAVLRPMSSRVKDFIVWEVIVSERFYGVKSFRGHHLNGAAADCRKSGRHR